MIHENESGILRAERMPAAVRVLSGMAVLLCVLVAIGTAYGLLSGSRDKAAARKTALEQGADRTAGEGHAGDQISLVLCQNLVRGNDHRVQCRIQFCFPRPDRSHAVSDGAGPFVIALEDRLHVSKGD